MPLWGKTDANADKPLNWVASMTGGQLIYVDETEASLEVNKERGLNAPGWWEYKSYTDTAGNTRHKAIHLIALVDTTTTETQNDDAIAADIAVLITINTQPADTAVAVGSPLQLIVDAISTPPGDASLLSYQWQKKAGTRWTNVGVNTPTYDVATYATTDAGSYRVKITSSNGAPEVISNTAVVTTA